MHILHARWLLADALTLREGGGVLVEGGRISRVLEGPGEVRRAAAEVPHVDLGDVVLAPGLVNAHAHLDLTALEGQVPPGRDFGSWVARLLEVRTALQEQALTSGVGHGADMLFATGTSVVGDIDSTQLGPAILSEHPLAAVVYREAIDAGDPSRAREVLERLRSPLPGALQEGLSPHAPFTVSSALLTELGCLAADRQLPVAIHWSETEAEVDWLESGVGPLAPLLGESPRRAGLDLLEQAGLLGPTTALIHGNHPRSGEPERLAAAGVTVVHCPGTHRFFDRPEAPLESYIEAGVRLALGTDSLASNRCLDMRREMAWLREAHPGLDPAQVWSMATRNGSVALGLNSGCLVPGARSDLAAFSVEAAGYDGILEELTAGIPRVAAVWSSPMELQA